MFKNVYLHNPHGIQEKLSKLVLNLSHIWACLIKQGILSLRIV